MRPFRILSLLIPILFLNACDSGGENRNTFPINSFLLQELAAIDSLPIAIFRTRDQNGILDTAIIEKNAFRKISMKLLDIDLQERKNKKIYQELVLEDIQLGNISISYTTEEANAALKKLELNTNVGSNRIKSIFAERHDKEGDTLLIRKILWTTETEMMVNTCYYKEGQLLNNITERYNWTIGN